MFLRKEILIEMIFDDQGSYPCDGCIAYSFMSVCNYFVAAGCCPYFSLSDDDDLSSVCVTPCLLPDDMPFV